MIKLSFGTDAKAQVHLTITEAARLRDHLSSRLSATLASCLPSRTPAQINQLPIHDAIGAAALAVEQARSKQ